MRGGEEGIENTFPAFTLSFLLPTCHLAVTLCLITTRGITVLGLIVSSASMYDKHVLLTVTRDFFFPPSPPLPQLKLLLLMYMVPPCLSVPQYLQAYSQSRASS